MKRWLWIGILMASVSLAACQSAGQGGMTGTETANDAGASAEETNPAEKGSDMEKGSDLENEAQEEISEDLNSGENSSTGTSDDSTEAIREIFSMDTFMTIHTYGPQAEAAANEAVEEIHRLNELFSVGIDTSEVSALNQEKEATVSTDTMNLITRSREIHDLTGGAYDITVFPLMEAWGFTSGNYRVPEEQEIQELLSYVDMEAVQADPETMTVTLSGEHTAIDLGGIAKGYTSARLMDIFREYGITSAMVSLGGNVQVLGTKTDGSLWRIGIENPEGGDFLGVLETADRAVITSGGYERYFEQDGKHYHHILDPSTGYPAESGLVSVTIVSPDGTMADALSTSLFVMGREKAVDYWREHRQEFDMILQDEDGTLWISEGIEESFEASGKTEIVRAAE